MPPSLNRPVCAGRSEEPAVGRESDRINGAALSRQSRHCLCRLQEGAGRWDDKYCATWHGPLGIGFVPGGNNSDSATWTQGKCQVALSVYVRIRPVESI